MDKSQKKDFPPPRPGQKYGSWDFALIVVSWRHIYPFQTLRKEVGNRTRLYYPSWWEKSSANFIRIFERKNILHILFFQIITKKLCWIDIVCFVKICLIKSCRSGGVKIHKILLLLSTSAVLPWFWLKEKILWYVMNIDYIMHLHK